MSPIDDAARHLDEKNPFRNNTHGEKINVIPRNAQSLSTVGLFEGPYPVPLPVSVGDEPLPRPGAPLSLPLEMELTP